MKDLRRSAITIAALTTLWVGASAAAAHVHAQVGGWGSDRAVLGALVDEYAPMYGASPTCMFRVLQQEGQLQLYPGTSVTNDHGPAQFHDAPGEIWYQSPPARRGESIDDPDANVEALAWALSRELGSHWRRSPSGC